MLEVGCRLENVNPVFGCSNPRNINLENLESCNYGSGTIQLLITFPIVSSIDSNNIIIFVILLSSIDY